MVQHQYNKETKAGCFYNVFTRVTRGRAEPIGVGGFKEMVRPRGVAATTNRTQCPALLYRPNICRRCNKINKKNDQKI